MGIFGNRKHGEPAWEPVVNLATARPVVFALAHAPVSNDAQVRLAVADFVRLSGRPSTEDAYAFAGALLADPEVVHRPWKWLIAVMRAANDAGDTHLPAAAMFWAVHWTAVLVPRFGLPDFVALDLDPIPAPLKAEIRAVGVAAVAQLPPDFVVVGDATGTIYAGGLEEIADVLAVA
jgi:hypothetical protein